LNMFTLFSKNRRDSYSTIPLPCSTLFITSHKNTKRLVELCDCFQSSVSKFLNTDSILPGHYLIQELDIFLLSWHRVKAILYSCHERSFNLLMIIFTYLESPLKKGFGSLSEIVEKTAFSVNRLFSRIQIP